MKVFVVFLHLDVFNLRAYMRKLFVVYTHTGVFAERGEKTSGNRSDLRVCAFCLLAECGVCVCSCRIRVSCETDLHN